MATHRRTPDCATADRLIAGNLVPDDAPPGFRRVAGLLSVAGAKPGEEQALAGPDPIGSLVAAIQHELTAQPSPLPRRSRVFSKAIIAKALAALSFVSLSATGAAAATGNLPSSVQDGLANAAEHVGVNLPISDEAKNKAKDKADSADADDKRVERVTEGCQPAADGTAFDGNRGQYLKQERAKPEEDALDKAKASRCGMPKQSQARTDDDSETPDSPEAEDGDHGKAAEDHGKAAEDHANPAAEKGSGNADDHPTKDEHPGGRP